MISKRPYGQVDLLKEEGEAFGFSHSLGKARGKWACPLRAVTACGDCDAAAESDKTYGHMVIDPNHSMYGICACIGMVSGVNGWHLFQSGVCGDGLAVLGCS